eukprot:tig00021623_g23019.t1
MAVSKKEDWLAKIVDQRGPLSAKLRVNDDIGNLGIKPPGIVLPPNFKIGKQLEPRQIFLNREAPFHGKEAVRAKRHEGGANRLHFEKKTNADAGKPKYPVFMEIVDHDANDEFEDYVSQDLLAKFLASGVFSNTILVVIFATSIMVGVSTDTSLTKQGQLIFDVLDRIFLTVFTLEIALKWGYGFFAFWRVGWNIFDFALVFISLMGELLGSQLAFLSSGRIMRIFRVLRAFRTLRSIAALKSLQIIVETILESLPDMANVILLLMIVYFIFAVISIDSFGEPPEMRPYWGTLENSFYTLFAAMTQDGWQVTYWATVDAGYFIPISAYYLAWIVGSAYIGVNILVGVLVTNLQIASKAQKKEDKATRSLVSRDSAAKDERAVKEVVDIDLMKPETWRHQAPLHMPDFSKVTPAALENYYLVLMAMEENLGEYKRYKEQVRRVVEVVRAANRSDSESESDYSDISDNHSLPDESRAAGGDVVSRMLAIDRERERKERERKAAETQKRRAEMMRTLGEEVPEEPAPEAAEADAEGEGDARGGAATFKQIGRSKTGFMSEGAGVGQNRKRSTEGPGAAAGALSKLGKAFTRSFAPTRRTSQPETEAEGARAPALHPFSQAALMASAEPEADVEAGGGRRGSDNSASSTLRRLATAAAAVHAHGADAEPGAPGDAAAAARDSPAYHGPPPRRGDA